MQAVEPPDSHHLLAAAGWMELGNHDEARSELAKISPQLAKHPDVLEASWMIHAAEEDWPTALGLARSIIESSPDRSFGWLHQAYALRRVADGGLQAAWEALLPAAERFPTEPTIPYNLSCYACQMGQLDDARKWLGKALDNGNRSAIKSMALADSDLEPLWDEIKGW
jgi:tetratricopeptide (TPR) repeat protein